MDVYGGLIMIPDLSSRHNLRLTFVCFFVDISQAVGITDTGKMDIIAG